ncbi:HEPN domain-containing protein [Arenicella xantha]|uniref:RiboL-PSP-HEPN domain-containing protein n=1 Tax=Arenicella xantha TaxID=644221 RepID=A0A395JML2_9GAMM|nr:HEPN domain-containing protein [Arenicella xantha]RBP52894.1 hypothetical protein DFR28_101278 [Arenicella xantha]
MTKAAKLFDQAIKDAEGLLSRFDSENNSDAEGNSEALKRAGMVMALAAWETYVKDRFKDEIGTWLLAVSGSQLGNFVQRRIDDDMKRFFNPNSAKTKQLFMSYFEIDITSGWKWDNYNPAQAKKVLDELVSKRGDAAHQASTMLGQPHIVKRDELEKAIRFLKGLVHATDCIRIAS